MMSKTEIEEWVTDLTEFKTTMECTPMKSYKADVMIAVLTKVLKQ